LGGRNLHWLLAGGSVVATLLSTLTFLSLPGEMIRYGVAFFSGLLALPLVIPVINRILIPMLMSLPITSMYEYLEQRYDVRVRTLAAAIFTLRTLLWMALIIYSCSFAVAEMTGWDIYLTILVTGLVTTMYTSAGGIRTVVWTDNLQLLVLLGGAVALPIYIGFSIGSGPLIWWESFAQAGRAHLRVFSLDPTVRITVIGMALTQFFWNICTNGSDQVAVQRYLSTPSLRAARRSVWVFALFNFFLIAILMVCGLALFAFYLQRSGLPVRAFQEQIAPAADRVMPMFIVQELPPGISGLVLAALLAAAMSSLSSGINSISGVVVSDFFQRFGWFPAHRGSLRVDKILSTLAGLLGICVALAITYAVRKTDWNLTELTQRVNHIFVGPLAVLFFGGILFRRAGVQAALAGFAAGSFISILVGFGKEWFGLARSISFIWLVPGSFVVGFVVARVYAALESPRLS
jgi:SSS family solute:Na+ symporter